MIFKSGIIGCGNIYSLHADALIDNRCAELVMVSDCINKRAKDAAKKYKCSYSYDYRELLDNDDVDVVHICTPHYLHASMAIEAMQKGKHVLIEKPIAMTENEAEAIKNVSKKTGCKVGVCFQNRYNFIAKTAKEIIDSGKLGKVIGGRVLLTWSREPSYYNSAEWRGTFEKEGGGVLINQAIHTLDLMQWLGGEVGCIEASVNTRYLRGVIEVEDTAEALITTKDGARIVFYATNANINNSAPLIEIQCENGTLRLEEDLNVTYKDGRNETIKNPVTSTGEKAYWGSSHEILIDHFYRSLINDEDFPLNEYMAANVLKLVLAFYRSSAEKTRVVL